MTAAVQDAAPAWAVVVAAGQGRRMGEGPAKQFRPLRGHPVLRWSLAALLELKAIRRVALVLAPGVATPALDLEADDAARLLRVDGGAERMDSVLCGLEALVGAGAGEHDPVYVHDAARPCLSAAALRRLSVHAGHSEGALLALPMTDTVKRAGEAASASYCAETLDRSTLWRAQTPQVFPLGTLTAALRAARAQARLCSDEAQAMEWAGHQPRLIPGEARNLKITTPEDLLLADWFLQQPCPS